MAIPNNGDFLIAGGALTPATDIYVAGGASDIPYRDYIIYGGDAIGLPAAIILSTGSYEYTGNDSSISRVLAAEAGDYSVTGSSADFTYYSYTNRLEPGSYTDVGFGLGFSRTLRLNAESSDYQLNGGDANIARQLVVSLAPSAFTFTGVDLIFKRNYTLVMAPATYTVTGGALSFGLSRQIGLNTGSYVTTGQPAEILRVRQFVLEAGSYAVTMEEAQVRPSDPTLTASPGSYAVTGNALNFTLTAAQLLGRYRPSRRRFQPAAYSFSTVKSHSGTSYRRMWASKPSDAILEIEIDNMFDFDAEDLCKLYDNAQGTYGYIGLPEEFYDGASPELTAMIAQPFDDLKWAFSEPPSISGVKGEVCNVVMRFKARRTPTLRA